MEAVIHSHEEHTAHVYYLYRVHHVADHDVSERLFTEGFRREGQAQALAERLDRHAPPETRYQVRHETAA